MADGLAGDGTSEEVKGELGRYRAGEISLGELAETWARRRWKKAAAPDAEGIPEVEAFPMPQPGTWDEVKVLRDTGQLTEEEYRAVSEAADAAARERAVNQE